jgi:hypothetical protein
MNKIHKLIEEKVGQEVPELTSKKGKVVKVAFKRQAKYTGVS